MEQRTRNDGGNATNPPAPANDLPSAIEAMLSVQPPSGAAPEFLSGWAAAMDAVTAAASSYTPSYTYQLYVDVHTGWVGIDKENALHMLGRGHQVQRRLSGRWEAVPRHGSI